MTWEAILTGIFLRQGEAEWIYGSSKRSRDHPVSEVRGTTARTHPSKGRGQLPS